MTARLVKAVAAPSESPITALAVVVLGVASNCAVKAPPSTGSEVFCQFAELVKQVAPLEDVDGELVVPEGEANPVVEPLVAAPDVAVTVALPEEVDPAPPVEEVSPADELVLEEETR
jgi:hypothetical protein